MLSTRQKSVYNSSVLGKQYNAKNIQEGCRLKCATYKKNAGNISEQLNLKNHHQQ
jgi:hypothetical protein